MDGRQTAIRRRSGEGDLIIVDANILISAVLGRAVHAQIGRLVASGVDLAAPTPQLAETYDVLANKLGFEPQKVIRAMASICAPIRRLSSSDYEAAEAPARARLHERAQSDWPVLAAALAFDAGVWSNDRDLFGVGVPVWSTRNVRFIAADA